jgi:ABC-type dipeptide/oligopeptide/nickel transport system permease subunit
MCFSMEFLKQVLILAVVIVAIVSILGLLIPFIVSRLGLALGEGWAVCVRAFKIFIWALVAILVIIFCFELIGCLLSFGGLHLH